MKNTMSLLVAAALSVSVAFDGAARADTLITSFEDFFENALYASWAAPGAIIDWGAESYSITATGYGSNWTYIGGLGVQGAGNTHLQLDVTLEGPPAADGHLGPIVTLVDADGSNYNFAWFGQLLGNNLLTIPVDAPTWIGAAGTTAGLDLNAIDHLHLQIDPGGFGTSGPYTVIWNELSLITVEGVPGDFDGDDDVDGRDFLLWQRGESTNGNADPGDLVDWQTNYGTPGLTAFSAIPEPNTIGLMILASVSAIGFRRPFKTMD